MTRAIAQSNHAALLVQAAAGTLPRVCRSSLIALSRSGRRSPLNQRDSKLSSMAVALLKSRGLCSVSARYRFRSLGPFMVNPRSMSNDKLSSRKARTHASCDVDH
jgi:hypothetical protein